MRACVRARTGCNVACRVIVRVEVGVHTQWQGAVGDTANEWLLVVVSYSRLGLAGKCLV